MASTTWKLTIDCASPVALAQFWAAALGYVPSPVPTGFASWEAWLTEHGVPEQEWDTGAFISDPEDVAPGISFLQVPEVKSVKNRLHLDIQAGGGRHQPWEQRWDVSSPKSNGSPASVLMWFTRSPRATGLIPS